MGVQVPLGSSAQLLRITAEQLEAMAAKGALAGLPRVGLRDGVLCQLNPQYRPHLFAKSAVYDALRDALRGLGRKRHVYATGDIPEYWVVDLGGQVVRRYSAPGGGAYTSETTVPFGGRLSAATLPGLRIDTAALRDEG